MKQYFSLKKQIEASRANQEFMRFQLQKIDDAHLYPQIQEELERERDIIANMTDIKFNLGKAVSILADSPTAILSQIKEAIQAARALDDVFNGSQSLSERLEEAKIEIQDIAASIHSISVGN